MVSIPPNLCVPPGTSIRLTLDAITKNGGQVALVTDPDARLLGIVTDGNVRKALLRGASLDAPVGTT
jgi:CBS domain-containing protein